MTPRAQLPPPVRPGDRVGIAALSGPVVAERLERGVEALEALGFEAVVAANAGVRDGLFAGSLAERLEGFHRLLADPTIAAVVLARGGHGILPLLPHLDWRLLGSRPRAFVGYSDATPLLLAITARLGWVTFHGPMVAVDFARGLTAGEEASFLDSLAGRLPRELPLAGAEGEGAVEGPLLGGCLSLLVATLGTPWAPSLGGAILFWEDTGEPAYRLDRMLTHLDLSTRLSDIRGMVIGHVDSPEGEGSARDWLLSARRLAAPEGRPRRWPLAWGLPAGHQPENRTLPLGWPVRLDPAVPRLTLLERRATPTREAGSRKNLPRTLS